MSEPEATPEGGNNGFTPIQTQDEFNAALAARLDRERAKFADYEAIKTKAAKFDEFEQASKSDLEKLQSQFSETKSERDSLASELTRLRIATKHGISEDDLDLLGTGTEEELTARAERIKKLNEGKEPAPTRRELHVAGEGKSPELALNGDGLESALKKALGIN